MVVRPVSYLTIYKISVYVCLLIDGCFQCRVGTLQTGEEKKSAAQALSSSSKKAASTYQGVLSQVDGTAPCNVLLSSVHDYTSLQILTDVCGLLLLMLFFH